MRPSSWFGAIGYYAAAIAVLAAITHGAMVLLIPTVAEHDAFSALSALAPLGTTLTLPRAAPGLRHFPYLDPAAASAFCRYDLSAGPIRVRAPLGNGGFVSISFHSRRGEVFYALTDRAAARGKLEAVIATPLQYRALTAAEDEDNPSQDLRIVAPGEEGFVFARVFSELPSLYAQAETQARALQCLPEPTNK